MRRSRVAQRGGWLIRSLRAEFSKEIIDLAASCYKIEPMNTSNPSQNALSMIV